MRASEIDYRVRRSDRARRVRVTVDATSGVEVVLPRRARDRDAAAAVEELRPWIERRLQELERARRDAGPPAGHVSYLGTPLLLVPEPDRSRVHRRRDELLVPVGDHRPALERWFRRAARDELVPRVDVAVHALGKRYQRLTIRNQRTRWGSCSSTGTLSFNWRLLLAPEPVLDYVVWHEACHLEVLDHSPRFRVLLAQHCPEWREHERWLRRYGSTLVI